MDHIFKTSDDFKGIAFQNIEPFYINKNSCGIKIKGFKKPFNCFLSHDGLFVYMYTYKNVYRTNVVYDSVFNKNCFQFPIQNFKELDDLSFHGWEILKVSKTNSYERSKVSQ